MDMSEIKVTPLDQQVLRLLVQGCSDGEIAGPLNISPRTVKHHLRRLFWRAGIKEGRKPLKLHRVFIRNRCQHANTRSANHEGDSGRDPGLATGHCLSRGAGEQVVNNYLRTPFEKRSVWTRLELALYVARRGRASWYIELGLGPLPTRGEWRMGLVDKARPLSSSGRGRRMQGTAGGTL